LYKLNVHSTLSPVITDFSIEPKRVNVVRRYQLQYLSVACNVIVCYVCMLSVNELCAAAKRQKATTTSSIQALHRQTNLRLRAKDTNGVFPLRARHILSITTIKMST